MKKLIFMVLLSLALFSFGYSQEQKANQIGLSFEGAPLWNSSDFGYSSGLTLNFTPAIGKKIVIEVGAAYYPAFSSQNSPQCFSFSAAPMFKIYSKKKLTFLAGAGAKMFYAAGGYLEGTESTPIAFLKGLMEYDLNGSWGLRAGISQNFDFDAALNWIQSIFSSRTTFDLGVYLRF